MWTGYVTDMTEQESVQPFGLKKEENILGGTGISERIL
jgi:hypothetical protein